MRRIVKIILFSLLAVSCKDVKSPGYRAFKNNQNLQTINLSRISENEVLRLDSVFYEPKYIPLETTDESLIGEIEKIIVRNDTIYVMESSRSQQAIFVFDKEGKFLYSVNARGNGPGEYVEIADFYVDTDNKQIGILCLSEIYKYDFNGNFVEKLGLRKYFLHQIEYSSGHIYGYGPTPLALSDKSYVVKVFDMKGDLIYDDYPERKDLISSPVKLSGKENFLTAHNKQVFLKPFYNDTIYEVKTDYISPLLVVDFGEYKFSEEKMDNLLKKSQDDQIEEYVKLLTSPNYVLFGVKKIIVGDNYLWLQFPKKSTYSCFYSLESKKTKLYNSWSKEGAENFFFPPGDFFTADGDEFYALITNSEMMFAKKLYNDPKVRAVVANKLLKNQEALHEKYLANYTIEDNPILMVFKLKDF